MKLNYDILSSSEPINNMENGSSGSKEISPRGASVSPFIRRKSTFPANDGAVLAEEREKIIGTHVGDPEKVHWSMRASGRAC
jgi:hypothetical protein